MPAPRRTVPFDRSIRDRLAVAHDTVVGARQPMSGVRRMVQESWRRALQLDLDPDRPLVRLDFDYHDLREYRDAHPLALALPTIERLLVRHTIDAGLIVAVGDSAGRLLWVDGDNDLRRKAEGMLFVEGADWSERTRGNERSRNRARSSTAGVQIGAPSTSAASCIRGVARPSRCTTRDSGVILGVIDITGAQAMPSRPRLAAARLEAAVAAGRGRAPHPPASSRPRTRATAPLDACGGPRRQADALGARP